MKKHLYRKTKSVQGRNWSITSRPKRCAKLEAWVEKHNYAERLYTYIHTCSLHKCKRRRKSLRCLLVLNSTKMHYTFLLRHVHYQRSCYLKFFFADNIIDVITYKAQPYDSSSLFSWTPLKELLDKSSLSLSSFNSVMRLRNVSVVGSMSIRRQLRGMRSLLGRRRISDEHRIVSHFEQKSWTLSLFPFYFQSHWIGTIAV